MQGWYFLSLWQKYRMTQGNQKGISKKVAGFLLPDSSKWLFWLCLAFLFRGVLFSVQIHDHSVDIDGFDIPGFIGGQWGDTWSYLKPIENLIHSGRYSPDMRMSGYGVLYLPLALLFSKGVACNILIFIQFLLSSVSIYALALGAKNVFKANIYFYLTFYLFAISTFSGCYDNILLTESLTTSLLVFSVFYFTRYLVSFKWQHIMLSGMFLTWAIFLRPVFLPVLMVFFFLVLVKVRKLVPAIVLISSFLVADGIWMIRNYINYQKIIPLAKSEFIYRDENSPAVSVMNFCKVWGGSRSRQQFWLEYDFPGDTTTPKFPDYIFTSKFNMDSITAVREMIKQILSDTSKASEVQRVAYLQVVQQKLTLYTKSIKDEHPSLYYVKVPWNSLKGFLKITYYSIVYLNQATIRYSVLFYYVTLLLGGIGIFLMFGFFFKLSIGSVFPGIVIYTVAIHAIYFRADENRYLVPAYPFIIFCASYCIGWVYLKFKGANKQEVV